MKTTISLVLLVFALRIAYSQNADFDELALTLPHGTGGMPSATIGSWSQLPASPHSVSRSCCVYAVVGGIPYLYQFGGGSSTAELKRVARLNLNTNVWQNNYSSMPYGISSGTAISVRGDSTIYVFGGSLPTLGKTLRYNVYQNSWSTMANMQTAATDAMVLKYDETYIYVIGGGDGYFGAGAMKTNAIQLYNTYTNTYVNKGSYPMACSMLGGGIQMDTIISAGGYVSGGVATSNCYKGKIDKSNMTISWSAIAPYPAGPIVRFGSYLATVSDGKGIMFTGGAINGVTPTASTYLWNFCTQTWQNGLPDISQARSNFKATGKGDGVIYIVAGYSNTNVGTTERISFSFIDGPCSMTGISGNSSVPDKFELKQNYPNPFNPSTIIRYGIPKTSQASLSITDISGRLVKTLISGLQQAGNYELSFDAAGLASGVYFYTLRAEGVSETKKMLLIK